MNGDALASSPPSGPGFEPLTFTGNGSEYFRIWIVNLALSVVTLGIYSAWAKVRRLQYFYRHTRLAGSSFDYHGNPIAILKGRIIGLGLFAVYTGAGLLGPVPTVMGIALVAGLMPWLLSRSLRFQLHNSSYRGLKFRFHGATADAYKVFLGLPVLTILTLGLLAPFTHQRIKRYQHGHAAYGRTRFAFRAEVSDFYLLYLAAAGLVVAAFAAGVFALFVLAAGTAVERLGNADGAPRDSDSLFLPIAIAFMTLYVIGIIGIQAFVVCRSRNLVWRGTRLAGHRFVSSLSARTLFRILLTNLFATVVTLGLYRPFAVVRLARYMVGEFAVLPAGSLSEFVADEQPDVDAAGEEAADLFDFDIAF